MITMMMISNTSK